jgi:outer membrane lipoprotein-sorting protein
MKKIILLIICMLAVFSQAEHLTATQILEKADAVMNAPKDQELKIQLTIIDKKGNERVRVIDMMQKGSDKRIAKFLSPADQKGIGFLSLPGGLTYIYLPAYKKTRRIASHVKNTKFAGTDFTYEDMEAKRYSDNWQAKLLKEEESFYQLQLKPKKDFKTDYAKLIVSVRTDNFYPTKIEYYDKGDNFIKVMNQKNVEMVDDYWVSKESEMEDLKTGNKTIMLVQEVKFDSGLSDDLFTERYLSR